MEPLESGLMIPTPEAEPVVGTHRIRLDQSAGWGVPAHVTVLYPFMPPADIDSDTEARLTALFATVDRFEFMLASIAWFSTDVVYAAPTPEEPFRALTKKVQDTWPEFLPYGGEHGEPIPHLTIGDNGTRTELAEAGNAVARHLPISCVAREVWLMTGSVEAGWTRRAVFPFTAGRRR